MKLAIVGYRGFNDYKLLEETCEKLMFKYEIELIISGGAEGADSLAEKYAKEHEFAMMIYKPEYWKYPGHIAPLKRNIQIVEACDFVLAFLHPKSRGTLHAINVARELGKDLLVIEI
ncbi:MAG: DUF2493 domain-containing protein [Nitrososphaeraceae archaeon]